MQVYFSPSLATCGETIPPSNRIELPGGLLVKTVFYPYQGQG